jgi:PKD repeat protein
LNSTIVFNSGYPGPGVYGGNLKNCIVFNNETYNNPQITGSATFSCIEGGYSGLGNIDSDPIFVEGPLGEYYLSQTASGQGQQSPCIDAGDPASNQIIGTTRTDELVDTGVVDMGFHYYCEPQILVNFSVDASYGIAPLTVQFENQSFFSLCEPVLRSWDFENDGIADSFEEDPTWTYSQPGNYSVSLILIGLDANNEFITDTILKESCIQAFMIDSDFSQDIPYGLAPQAVNFFDASFILNTELSSWQWDFENDGIIDSYEQNPAFTYNEPGIYSVMLIIQDSSLVYSDTAMKKELITICNIQPGFYANPLSGVSPLEVQFYDTTKVEFTQIGSWQWDFNNDGIYDSQEQMPEWIFDQVGKFSIRLIVRDTSQTIVKFLIKEDYIETFSSGIGSNMTSLSKNFRIFPNPFTNELIIEADLEENATLDLRVYDVNFRLVKIIAKNEKAGKKDKTWIWENKNSDTPPGVYFISLTTGKGIQYLKKCIKIE